MQAIISFIIPLILAVVQSGGFWALNSTLPSVIDWPELDPLFVVVPIFVSIFSVLWLYLPRKHSYDDFIKNDKKYKKYFWLSFMVSMILSFLMFMKTNNMEMLAIAICLICSILGAILWFIAFAVIVRRLILSLRNYPTSLSPF